MSDIEKLDASEFVAAAETVKRVSQQYAHMQRAASALEAIGSLANTKAELEAAIEKKRAEVARLEAVVVSAGEEASAAQKKADEVLAAARSEGDAEIAKAKARAKEIVDGAQARADVTLSEAQTKAAETVAGAEARLKALQETARVVSESLVVNRQLAEDLAKDAVEARAVIERAEKIRSAMG